MLKAKLQLKKLRPKKIQRNNLLRFECFLISDEPAKKCFAGFIVIGVVSLPGVEGWVLKGASKTKGNWPGEGTVFGDFGQVVGGLLDGLATREEYNSG